MNVLLGHRAISRPIGPHAVALGILDGVHRGHQAVLRRTRELSGSGLLSLVYSFHPHPSHTLTPHTTTALIEPVADRIEHFARYGFDHAIIEPFDQNFSAMSAGNFVENILSEALRARHVVVGSGFVFGHRAQGDRALLEDYGRRLGFEVHEIEPVPDREIRVSSTAIRESVRQGDLETARRMLGRPFANRGRVVPGAGRGRTLGIPTANLRLQGELTPKPGVYAVEVQSSRGMHPAVINLGHAPTFHTARPAADVTEPPTCEAHLLDFDGDLYDQTLEVRWHHRLRDEQRFSGPEALVVQVQQDIAEARKFLDPLGSEPPR